jgi:5-methylcytosine-specific restriction endonuclease McrA
MWALEKPVQTGTGIFATCAAAVAEEELRNCLQAVEDVVSAAERDYEAAGTAPAFHTFPRSNVVGPNVSKEDMKWLYEHHFVAEGSAGRAIYNALRAKPRFKLCPLCGVGQVSTLDHYLPKSKYPVLAVLPANLVPACSDCNRAKGTKAPATEGSQTLHPYYDNFDDGRWLHAAFVDDAPPSLRFFACGPDHWSQTRRDRVARHLEVFKLGPLFASNASQELVNIRQQLVSTFAIGGPGAVRAHLREQAASREQAYRNSWQTAMYDSLAGDDLFCDGAFQRIPAP